MKQILYSLICITLLASVSFGDSTETQDEMNQKAVGRYNKAERKLEILYNSLLKSLDNDNKQRLIINQNHWVKYRDMDCDAGTSMYQGGTIYPLEKYSCLAGFTEERIEDIRSIYLKQGDKFKQIKIHGKVTFERMDKELNDLYNLLIKIFEDKIKFQEDKIKLTSDEKEKLNGEKTIKLILDDKRKLIESSEAWIKYRDSLCDAILYRSNSRKDYRIIKYSCLAEITKRRIDDIKADYWEPLQLH